MNFSASSVRRSVRYSPGLPSGSVFQRTTGVSGCIFQEPLYG